MTIIISHSECLLHNAEIQHPECPERLKVINQALSSSGLEPILLLYLLFPEKHVKKWQK
ncbi:hypothetical protein Ldro_1841 [Legionella drozanskii LLAP-1]|uniref:Histone deacetylase-like amidohydrolase n=1 Tax=Legionella drozanskii LLAP-1 TaxID=1212489 RepID=A0A0W0SU74_9GAMM|nr:hypothetical protein Ldro_1841 [Legionella drozanskii LLAP-1]